MLLSFETMKRSITDPASWSSAAFGYSLVAVRTHSYTIAELATLGTAAAAFSVPMRTS